jgi:opacity protein-like surface antigen
MHDGLVLFDQLGLGVFQPQIGRYNTERYGFFLQTDYHWGDVTRPAYASANAAPDAAPMNWTGFYVGGHVGGAFSDNRWSDPFPGAKTGLLLNDPGFGDTVHGTGPLAGGQAGFNWQTGSLVLGLKGAWSKTDLRGENTCYSGVGGLNCQNIINSVGTLTGRLGYAWDRALVYAEGGAARGQIDYMLLGDTNNQGRGYGVTPISAWGWTAGGGLEYALTDHWTTMVEYQHVDFGTNAVTFPTVALVKLQGNAIFRSRRTDPVSFEWMQCRRDRRSYCAAFFSASSSLRSASGCGMAMIL